MASAKKDFPCAQKVHESISETSSLPQFLHLLEEEKSVYFIRRSFMQAEQRGTAGTNLLQQTQVASPNTKEKILAKIT